MSIISSLLGGGNILSSLLNIASMIFPAAQLAQSLLSAFSSMIKDVIKGGIEELVKNSGMPKFLGDAINKFAEQIFGGKTGGSMGADQAVQQSSGDALKTIGEGLMKGFIENVKDAMSGGESEEGSNSKGSSGKGSSGGWLVALAKAFGKLADAAAKELKEQGQSLSKENPSDMIEYQAKTQEFAQMMNTFINAIKTIGEAQTSTVRKG
jgi:hypothetical protein